MKALKIAALCCSALCASTTMAADFVAIKVEAEDYFSKDARWRLTSNTVNSGVTPDPDGSHHSSASGQAYLELLSDTRVTHGDPLINGVNFWSTGGSGPAIDYIVNIPEAGRYTVWVKAYSTGTEDNGIHVGLNSSNPASGERIQWCSGKNQWTWSSAQRMSDNHCGTPRTIYLDIGSAGANTIRFTAREDGFEMDQFMLIKENVSGLSCAPQANDTVGCNQPATPSQPIAQPEPTPEPAPEPAPTTPEPAPTTPEPEPTTPEPTPAPEVPMQEDGGNTAALPACSSAASDSDGDGYGWENDQSCVVTSSGTDSGNSDDNGSDSNSGLPTCASAASDSDGDGWGWENNQSCLVSSGDTGSSDSGTPYCSSAASDSDGDGWGWENDQSCLVR